MSEKRSLVNISRGIVTKSKRAGLRTWIEISRSALGKNIALFKKIIGPQVKLWAVVKSNAYGHGLYVFSKLADELGAHGFCVDSCVEGLRLRKEGIQKPILVLGATLPAYFDEARKQNITLTISNFEALQALLKEKNPPQFHVKIDTGMHRQGFYLEDIPKVIKKIKSAKHGSHSLAGIYTHFSSVKDINYPTYTEMQFATFEKARALFKKAGYKNLIAHAANTAATLVNKKYHLNAVRVGIGIYGLWPSKELEIQLPNIKLTPVLSWRTFLAELKKLKTGDYVGYDLAERLHRKTNAAVLPVGYWHGLPRAYSRVGDVLVNGKRARVLGRVSMDMTSVDVTGNNIQVGDTVTLIGKDGRMMISAFEVAQKADTVHYELLTRLNPLMERIIV